MKLTLARSFVPTALLTTLAALAVSAAYGQGVDLTFSGGSGAAIELTIDAPVTYTVTAAPQSFSPYFLFQGTGSPFDKTFSSGTGNLTYTITNSSGTTTDTITRVASGDTAGSVTANDSFIAGAFPGVSVGDVVTLQSGTFTTDNSFPGAVPANGFYSTFLGDGRGDALSSDNIAAAPEPSTWAMILGGLGLLVGVRRLRPARQA